MAPENSTDPRCSPPGDPLLPDKQVPWRLILTSLLVFSIPPILILGMAVMFGDNVPPKPLGAIVWLLLFFGGPALVILGVCQLLRGRWSIIAAGFYVIFGTSYFLLAILMTRA